MDNETIELLAKAAEEFKLPVYFSSEGWWCRRTARMWYPQLCNTRAFLLMVAMRAELQYLEGKQEAVITSNDGKISFSLPYGMCVETVTRALVCKLAIEVIKRKK